MTITVVRATALDLDAILGLLRRSALPLDGVAAQLDRVFVARDGEVIVGCAGLEIYGQAALLRSVAVDASVRGRGLGHALTQASLDLARSTGVTDVFLLTTTAEAYFSRLGFERVARSEVPATVAASVEFVSACPASATAMRKRLGMAP